MFIGLFNGSIIKAIAKAGIEFALQVVNYIICQEKK